MNIKNEHKKLIENDKNVVYLLNDLLNAKESNDSIKITLFIKRGNIVDKQYTVKKYRGK